MMERPLGFAIMGCGVISETHARAVKAVEGVELIAASSRREERAVEFAKKYNCDYYTDYHEMLKREDIDIVIICTPSGVHAQHGIDVARARKHVMVEKPIEITIEASDELIRVCKEEGVKLTCVSQSRFAEDIVKLKNAIDQGLMGQLNFGEAHTKFFRSQKYYDSASGRGTWAMDGGGALMIQGLHYVDLLHYMMGHVDEVFAYCATREHDIEVEDIAAVTLKFKNGALGLIEANTAAFPGFQHNLGIYGRDGAVTIEGNIIKEWKLRHPGMKFHDLFGYEIKDENDNGNKNIPKKKSYSLGEIDFVNQIKDFVDVVNNDTEPIVTGESAKHSLAIILAIYESARTGKAVKVK